MYKLEESKKIIEEAFKKYKRPLVACSFGKDSVTMLHIIKETFGEVPCPVLANDTGFWFEEIRDLMHKLRKEWDLEIIYITRFHPKAKDVPPSDKWEAKHLKLTPSLWAIKGYGADAVFAGIRRSESKERRKAKAVEKREGHDRIHPLINWTEEDIWYYIKTNGVPYCKLYDKGYRSIGSKPFTKPSTGDERSGRDQDKEKIMEQLRALGYW